MRDYDGENSDSRSTDPDAIPRVTIHIGGVHVSKKAVRIQTLLGSCVAACLFDGSTKIGGMNHFLLPGALDGSDLSSRYGINAMEILINEMMKAGANRKRLQAKVFGGANIFRANHELMAVGNRNIQFIREFLDTEEIPIVNERLGGNDGLIVHFYAYTFEVFVKRVSMEAFKHKEKEESAFLKKAAREMSESNSRNITLF